MAANLIQKNDYFRTVFDILPSSLFVVNHDFKIFDLNPAASALFSIDSDVVLRRLCGEIFHCLHAIESGGGCGKTKYCPDCVIRNSVEDACEGKCVQKNKYEMKIQKGSDVSDVCMLVSTSPFKYKNEKFVLLVIEDISEIVKLKRLLPICSNCKKIRNDQNYWEGVTDYLKKHEDLEFTHGICPECTKKLYPDLNC